MVSTLTTEKLTVETPQTRSSAAATWRQSQGKRGYGSGASVTAGVYYTAD